MKKKSQGKCELYLYCIEAAERTQIMETWSYIKGTTLAINCKGKKCTSISSWKTLNHPHPVDNEILFQNMFI